MSILMVFPPSDFRATTICLAGIASVLANQSEFNLFSTWAQKSYIQAEKVPKQIVHLAESFSFSTSFQLQMNAAEINEFFYLFNKVL